MQEFGIEIIGEENKTVLHHMFAACIICVLTEEDVKTAVRVEHVHAQPFSYRLLALSHLVAAKQLLISSARPAAALTNSPNPALGGMTSRRPPDKGGITFDHVLSQLQGELQKCRDTSTELHSHSNAMGEVRSTLVGQLASPFFQASCTKQVLIRSFFPVHRPCPLPFPFVRVPPEQPSNSSDPG